MLTDKEKERLEWARAGMVRVQQYKLQEELAKEGIAKATTDAKSRFAAAENLIAAGIAVEIKRGEKYVNKGPLPASGKKRKRIELIIVKRDRAEI